MLPWAYRSLPRSSDSSLFSYDESDRSFACPTLASPASSSACSDQDGTFLPPWASSKLTFVSLGSPSPLQLNEFTNVFDFDFSTSLPHEFPASSSNETIHESLPSSLTRKQPSTCSLPRNLSPSDFATSQSRDSSPPHSAGHDPKRRFPCLILGCPRRFTSQYTLKVHMEAHRPKPRASFPCTLGCSEHFSRQHDRLRHEVAKHGKICEFSCDHCGRFFSSGKTLGNHKCPVSQGETRWIHA
jgi:hypothetical protein